MSSRTAPASVRATPPVPLRTIVGVGMAFVLLQIVLIATFPILSGSELRSQLQGMAVSALEFPLGYVEPLVAGVAGSKGGASFFLGLALTFLNGALWTAALLRLRRRMRESRS